jgi:hypothetical protein
MHNRGYVYVDVKPQNFMIGYGEKAQVIHVVDLGKAGDIFRNAGTLKYASVSSHQGKGTCLTIILGGQWVLMVPSQH